ncbi:hypothetical protein C0075_00785 [Rhizobium sp. KAs_5_22]|uniref:hypothetical protein n=1 Tax=Ciceribacter selenitireducens TaxID=448181 RepID=UPI00048E5958|nr:hypothetical protein [Ciceribacter selenitireducens]PPJ49149.1 hypothetical protein C0075_00785 [Rhizobium sp. KAs_5_22]
MTLKAAIEQRYPHNGGRVPAMRERIIEVAQAYLDAGQGDVNALQRLCSTDEFMYWQQLSEVLLGYQLGEAGITFTHQAAGPDFLIEREGRRIWVEVITPTPTGIPANWLAPAEINGVRDFPHEQILLRWTAAIKQKAEVLLGQRGQHAGYLGGGIVGADDCYVIAVNARLLRGYGGTFTELTGISQWPFAVEATLAIGPLQVRINRDTLESSEPEHQQRYVIHKPVGQPVPADTFLDERFAPISAIWAADIDEMTLLDRPASMVVVHNPRATHTLPLGLLPAQEEYRAAVLDDEHYQLERIQGISAQAQEISVTVEP